MEMTEDCSDPLEAVFNNSDPLLPLLLGSLDGEDPQIEDMV